LKAEFRMRNIAVAGVALWTVLFLRLGWLQVLQGGHYRALAQRQHQFRVGLVPERGQICDRLGRPLALSVDNERCYPYGAMAAQTLGAVSEDGRGLEGLELLYDDILRGQSGWTIKQLDARGRSHPSLEYANKPAQAGGRVLLTIDADYQTIADQELARGADGCDAASATALVINPTTGEVLALACRPAFRPDDISHADPDAVINKAIVDQFEPGSTFKAITMAAALEEQVVEPGDLVDGGMGSYAIGGHTIGEAEGHKYGRITAGQALAYSSNVCLVKIGMKLGKDKLYQYARSFGFGCKTGIEFPGEAEGALTRPSSWSIIQNANICFGQGLSVTAVQMASAYGAIGNGGFLMRPRLVRAYQDPSGQLYQAGAPDTLRRVISPETAQQIVDMLKHSVDDSLGTGKLTRIKGWSVAGKTGTAQKKVKGQRGYAQDRYVASFVGMLPAESPRILVLVIMNEPKGQFYGGQVAAPVCRNILKRIVSLPQGVAPELLASGKLASETF